MDDNKKRDAKSHFSLDNRIYNPLICDCRDK